MWKMVLHDTWGAGTQLYMCAYFYLSCTLPKPLDKSEAKMKKVIGDDRKPVKSTLQKQCQMWAQVTPLDKT